MTGGGGAGPTARPRRRRKEARPAEIIEAGLAEFGERGFGAARMEDVARRAGVSKGTVFHYFPTKEALFEAALVSRVGPVFDLADLDAHEGHTLGLLEAVMDRFYAELEEPELGALMRAIIAEGPRFPAILESYHRLSIARGQALLAAVVARGAARGEFRRGAVLDLPMVLVAPAVMAAVWHMTFDRLQPIPLARFKEAHLDMLRAALLARA